MQEIGRVAWLSAFTGVKRDGMPTSGGRVLAKAGVALREGSGLVIRASRSLKYMRCSASLENKMKEKSDINVAVKRPDQNGKPFVLIWADEVAIGELRSKQIAFSEALGGIAGNETAENPETTNGPQNEGADTTFS
jgi:hypothetical protein